MAMTPLVVLLALLVLLFAGGAIALLLDACLSSPGPNWPGVGAAIALIAASAVMAESARICSMLEVVK